MPNTTAPKPLPKKIGIVIPAHNEADSISACLDAIKQAIAQLSSDIAVQTVVVLDSCDDDTLSKVQNAQVDWLRCEFRCVGKVRDLGVRYLIEQGADWIAKWSTKNLGQSHDFADGSEAVVVTCRGLFRLSVETRQSDSANDRLKSRHCRSMRC